LRAACETLADNEIVGLEIAEFEATWPDSDEVASPAGLIEALQPVLDALCRASQ
jgi:arginase